MPTYSKGELAQCPHWATAKELISVVILSPHHYYDLRHWVVTEMYEQLKGYD